VLSDLRVKGGLECVPIVSATDAALSKPIQGTKVKYVTNMSFMEHNG